MSLDEFCNAIGIANTGSWAETGADSNPELVNFWHSVSVSSLDTKNVNLFD